MIVNDESFDWKTLTDFLLIGVTLIGEFQSIVKIAPDVADASGPASILMSIINRKPAFDANKGVTLSSLKGKIEFKHVAFKYPQSELGVEDDAEAANADETDAAKKKRKADANRYIFGDFSLTVNAGESVAFVGPSGCGKSTLFSLLLRFYDVTNGSLLIDDEVDIKSVNLKWWLRNVGVVSQEAVIFKGTLRDNILYGIEEAERAKIPDLEARTIDACRRANLGALLDEKGLDFFVGERGAALSGGQKQRVCIARVFMKQPKILLLDEVTSALDAISEAEVVRALEELMVGRTTFIIAHRLHTLQNVDRIYVLKDGKINDQGSHQELSQRDGFFKTMWDKQQGERSKKAMGGSETVSNSGKGVGVDDSDLGMLLELLEVHDDELKRSFPQISSVFRRLQPHKKLASSSFREEMLRRNGDSSDSDGDGMSLYKKSSRAMARPRGRSEGSNSTKSSKRNEMTDFASQRFREPFQAKSEASSLLLSEDD